MEHIRLFETEASYHDVKDSFEYPTVSYTKDSQIVWYMEKPKSISYEVSEWFADNSIDLTNWSQYNGNQVDSAYEITELVNWLIAYYETYGNDASQLTLYGKPCRDLEVEFMETRVIIRLLPFADYRYIELDTKYDQIILG